MSDATVTEPGTPTVTTGTALAEGSDTDGGTPEPPDDPGLDGGTATGTAVETPGFGAVVAVAGLLVAARGFLRIRSG